MVNLPIFGVRKHILTSCSFYTINQCRVVANMILMKNFVYFSFFQKQDAISKCYLLILHSFVYPANSNLVILNSLLFWTPNHFVWIFPSFIYYRYFILPIFLAILSVSLKLQGSTVLTRKIPNLKSKWVVFFKCTKVITTLNKITQFWLEESHNYI